MPSQPASHPALDRIVLPTDFSICAERALPRALALAEYFGAEIHLLHVLRAYDAEGTLPDSEEEATWREEGTRARLEATRMAYRYGLPGARAAPLKLAVMHDEAPAPAIARYAQAQAINLVVMGTHGWSFHDDAVLGSVTAEVLQLAPCPVLTVSAFRQPTGLIRKVLAVVHPSADAEATLRYAGGLAATFDAQLVLLGAANDAPVSSHRLTSLHLADNGRLTTKNGPAVPADALRLMEHLIEISRVPPNHVTVYLTGASLAEVVPRVASEQHADLIVLPAAARRLPTGALDHDLAYRVIRTVACSVLVLKTPAAVSPRSAPESAQRMNGTSSMPSLPSTSPNTPDVL